MASWRGTIHEQELESGHSPAPGMVLLCASLTQHREFTCSGDEAESRDGTSAHACHRSRRAGSPLCCSHGEPRVRVTHRLPTSNAGTLAVRIHVNL
mmetsp:Transcript_46580/g.122286  ORF Transcript_46580/g.122286 Transcript_46580/m.122286 type:complete len:96 (+) Transcript_46580:209-496(+)